MTIPCPGGTQAGRFWAPTILFLLACAATSVGGCTALVLSAAEQCEVDEDCKFLGEDYTCNADRICAVGEVVTTDCMTDQDCIDAGLDDYTCNEEGVCEAPPADCTTSQECIDAAGGAPSACIDNECVTLTTSACQEVVPEEAIGDDDTIFVGWMGPLTGDFESIGVPMKRAVELALEEIVTFNNGLPGGADGARRKLAMIACHDLDDPIAVAEHLTNKVKVPVIIGPAFSGITLDVSTEVTIPAGTLIVSPSATSPAISDLDDAPAGAPEGAAGLVWRTAPSDALQAIPLSYLVGQLETRIRTEQALMPSDNIKVSAASKGDAYGQGLINSLTDVVTFNGQNVTDNLADNAFQSQQYPDPSTEMVDFSSYVNNIISFEPHLVLPLGTNEGITEIMGGTEAGWPSTPPPERPLYLFPDGGRLDELLAATKSDADLRGRVKGTVPGKQGANYQSFALRFENRWGQAPGTFTENAYDAAYLIAYAIVATGEVRPTGAQIAEGLTKTTGGQTDVVAGPNELNAGFNAMSSGGAIDYDGASGPLDFDIEKGEAAADIDIWCVELDNMNEAIFVSSGEFYSAEMNQVVGTDTCGN
jgi:branched-chain amino acid transport system substrate-binding protein